MGKENEKRLISRADWEVDCFLIHNERFFRSMIQNLSLTGLLLKICGPVSLEPGHKIIISITWPSPDDICSRIDCEVVRCNGRYAGVKYRAIDYDTLMLLKAHLSFLMKDAEKLDREIIELIKEHSG